MITLVMSFQREKGAIGLKESDLNLFIREPRIGPFCSASAILKRFGGYRGRWGAGEGSQSVEGPHPRPAVDKGAG